MKRKHTTVIRMTASTLMFNGMNVHTQMGMDKAALVQHMHMTLFGRLP
jgi:hypothetical protein